MIDKNLRKIRLLLRNSYFLICVFLGIKKRTKPKYITEEQLIRFINSNGGNYQGQGKSQ